MNRTLKQHLSIVISAYNEEGNIQALYRHLKSVAGRLPLKSVEFIFVDDGSTDGTCRAIMRLKKKDGRVKIVRLVRNFGHEIAMTAGMDHARGDGVVFMDADLQHPPKYIADMVRLWQNGSDIVLTKRQDNLAVSSFYKWCACSFYKILNFLSEIPIPEKMPDFRLIDRKYINYLKRFNESDRLFRGMLGWMMPDARVAVIPFVAPERLSGKSKYNFKKAGQLALNSILQFSVKPLYLALWLAILSALFALCLGAWVIVEHFILNNPTPGYATVMATIVFMGSMNLFMFAIQGAYIAKIHVECKKRPLYLAEFSDREEEKEHINAD